MCDFSTPSMFSTVRWSWAWTGAILSMTEAHAESCISGKASVYLMVHPWHKLSEGQRGSEGSSPQINHAQLLSWPPQSNKRLVCLPPSS